MAQIARFIGAAALIGALVSSGRVHAETGNASDRYENADRLFHDGITAFEAGRYSEAYAALRSAWDLAPSYRTAAGLGQVELHLGQYRDAASHLSYCARNVPTDGDADVEKHVEAGLADAREHVAALRVRVDPEGATVKVDGAAIGRAPLDGLVFVDPGSHVVEATAPGHEAAKTRVDAALKSTLDVSLTLPEEKLAAPAAESAPKAPNQPDVAATSSPPDTSGWSPRTWDLVIGGSATALATGAAIVFAVKGSSAQNDVDDLHRSIAAQNGDCSNGSSAQSAQCAELSAKANDRNHDNTAALIFGVSAGVLAAATAVVWFALPARSETDRSHVSLAMSPVPGGGVAVVAGSL